MGLLEGMFFPTPILLHQLGVLLFNSDTNYLELALDLTDKGSVSPDCSHLGCQLQVQGSSFTLPGELQI